MVGGSASVSGNLKTGLEHKGHTVVLACDPSPHNDDTVRYEYRLRWCFPLRKQFGDGYDIIHVHSPNLKKYLMIQPYLHDGVPLVCHWHGSDLRIPFKSFPMKHHMIQNASMNIYSTCDLAWWIQTKNKMLLNCPVDTDIFKPLGKGEGCVVFDGGGKAYAAHKIQHHLMPGYLNRFAEADIHNAMGLDDSLFSVIAFEAASCGLRVKQFPWMDRQWVVDNCDVDVVAERLERIYYDVFVSLRWLLRTAKKKKLRVCFVRY